MRTWSNDRSHLCRTPRLRRAGSASRSGAKRHAPRRHAASPVFTSHVVPVHCRVGPARSLPVPAGTIELRTIVSVEVDRRTARVGGEEWFRGRGGGLAGGDYPNPLPGKAVFVDVSLFLGNRELRSETTMTRNARATAGSVRPWFGPTRARTPGPTVTTRIHARNGRSGSTLSPGDAAGSLPARGVAIVFDVSGSLACAGMDRARQAVRPLFGTPGRADRFRPSPSGFAAGPRPPRRARAAAQASGRSSRGTLAGGGVRIGRAGRRSSLAGSPDPAPGSHLVLRPWAAREADEPMHATGHERPVPVLERAARGIALRCGPSGEYTTHLVQEPPGGGVSLAGRIGYP